jgi:CheY-like chemotaxis protein
MKQFAPLEGRRILVIEDDYILAETLCAILEDAGARVVGPIGWLEEALAFINANAANFDSAILDVNLHGEKSYPIADALLACGIRCAFSTGYDPEALDRAYRSLPRCQKPFTSRSLVELLA